MFIVSSIHVSASPQTLFTATLCEPFICPDPRVVHGKHQSLDVFAEHCDREDEPGEVAVQLEEGNVVDVVITGGREADIAAQGRFAGALVRDFESSLQSETPKAKSLHG